MSFRDGRELNFVSWNRAAGRPVRRDSGGVDRRDVDQHDRNIVLNRVNAAADGTFQAESVRIRDHRLFTDGADQYVKQILRNHRDNIVMLHDAAGKGKGQFFLPGKAPGKTGECDAIESLFALRDFRNEVRWQPEFLMGLKSPPKFARKSPPRRRSWRRPECAPGLR